MERWAAYYRWLNEQGLADGLDPECGFTNDFLPD